jgi:hypothetical protein
MSFTALRVLGWVLFTFIAAVGAGVVSGIALLAGAPVSIAVTIWVTATIVSSGFVGVGLVAAKETDK